MSAISTTGSSGSSGAFRRARATQSARITRIARRDPPSPAEQRTAPDTARHGLAGAGLLLRLMLRRDRFRSPAWVLGISAFALYCGAEVRALGTDPASLRESTALFAGAVGRMLTGPGLGLDDPTPARFFAAAYALYVFLLVALLAAFTVVRHTRADEQAGRAELVRASAVGRYAQLTAALALAILLSLAASLVLFGACLALGYPAAGSLLVAASALGVGAAFAGIAALAAQLVQSSRAAAALAGGAIALAFGLRMLGDAAAAGGAPPSWASPLGWAQLTGPYVLDRWWPLALLAALACASLAVAFRLSTARDVGAGLLPGRPGAARGSARLGTPAGLSWRILRGGLRSWGLSLVLAGLAFGGYAKSIGDSADNLPEEFRRVLSSADLALGYMAFMVVFLGILVAAAAVAAMHQLRAEETSGRVELVLAAGVGRVRHLVLSLGIIAVSLVVILAGIGLATGVGAYLSAPDLGVATIPRLTLGGLAQAPAALAVLGIVAAVHGWLPHLAAPVGWAVVGFGAVLTAFGELLDLPGAVRDLDVFGHLAMYPVDPFAWIPAGWLLAIAAAGAALSVLGFRAREIAHK